MKLKLFSILAFGFILSLALPVSAQIDDSFNSIISPFRFYKDVQNVEIDVPTVVEVLFADEFIERLNFAVVDIATNTFEPYYFKREVITNEISVLVSSNPILDNLDLIIDKDNQTSVDFLLPNDEKGIAKINITSPKPITASSLSLLLTENVALPNTIEIRAVVEGQERIIVATKELGQQTTRFLQTVSDDWSIILTFGQPLRISELKINQDNIEKSSTRLIRFLAQPDSDYRIYFDPDRQTEINVGESGNLVSDQDVLILPSTTFESSPNYVIADVDGDGVADTIDNCVAISNTEQIDVNDNGRGDACDDFDKDGIINDNDNCLNQPNRNQKDIDSDGLGDVCDKEESRITEKYVWLPWVGIGFAALIIITLFTLTAVSYKKEKEVEEPGEENKKEEADEKDEEPEVPKTRSDLDN